MGNQALEPCHSRLSAASWQVHTSLPVTKCLPPSLISPSFQLLLTSPVHMTWFCTMACRSFARPLMRSLKSCMTCCSRAETQREHSKHREKKEKAGWKGWGVEAG